MSENVPPSEEGLEQAIQDLLNLKGQSYENNEEAEAFRQANEIVAAARAARRAAQEAAGTRSGIVRVEEE